MINTKKKSMIILLINIMIFIIISIGFAFAYFSAQVLGNANEDVVITGTMRLAYTDGPEINIDGIMPGFSVTKQFSVKNIGTVDLLYDIKLNDFTNQIINNEMEYSVTCKSYSKYYGSGNENNVLKGDCLGTEGSFEVQENSSKTLIENIYIKPEIIHVYDLTLTFIETGELQNYNQGKSLTGVLNVEPSNTERLAQLENIFYDLKSKENQKSISKTTEAKIQTDYIQPWMITSYSYDQILRNLKVLKRADINNVILTNAVLLTSVGVNTVPKFKEVYYPSNLTQYYNQNTEQYDVFEKVMNAAEELGMKVYLGITSTEDWWVNNKVKNQNWKDNQKNIGSEVIIELYNMYNTKSSFKGFYYPNEMYFNTENLETHWTEIINSAIGTINSLNSNVPIMTSTFFSSSYDLSTSEIESKWDSFFSSTNFRNIDIFTIQDGLGTTEKDPNYMIEVYQIFKNLTETHNLNYELNIELFDLDNSANIKRVKSQIEIASYYADALQSFSYTYYYSPYIKLNELYYNIYSNDIYYREYIGKNVEDDQEITIIENAPANGKIYIDKNRDEAPIPSGFIVSEEESVIQEGLVIKDSANNEFVWIPVNGEVKENFYNYGDSESQIIHYARNCGDIDFYNLVTNASFPSGVLNDLNQINKYKGFYIGRYESLLDYNNGNFRVKINQGEEEKVNPSFAWQYADTDYYTGTLWNNIKFEDSKEKAEGMSGAYDYHSSVKTGLPTGKAWDTVIRFLTYDDETYTFSWNSRGWGNHSDSIDNAATGNYISGTLRNTGTNEGWKLKNVYDVAGNLYEWTNETNGSGEYVLRGGKYNSSGSGNPASSEMLSGSYQFSHTGFRVMLYID